MQDYILWADVESTGTDTLGIHGPRDELLQIAGFITTPDLVEIGKPFDLIIQHDNPDELYNRADSYVKKMHTQTGLWDKLKTGTPLEEVDFFIFNYMIDVLQSERPENGFIVDAADSLPFGVPEGKFIVNSTQDKAFRLAGNSIRLDLNNIEAFLPRVHSMLHYRSIDVSAIDFVVRNCLKLTDKEYVSSKTHNAVDDVRDSLEHLRWLYQFMDPQHVAL